MILGENGEKMSKSRGNVVNPDDIVDQYGADTMRLYEMFIGDFEKSAPWNTSSIKGCKRFLERAMSLLDIVTDGDEITKKLERSFHVTIKKVTEDIDSLKFNTALASLMSLINEIYDAGSINRAELRAFVTMLCPFAPHLCEEMWQQAGFEGDMTYAPWPKFDESKTVLSEIEIAVQIMGKVRGKLVIPADADEKTVMDMALADEHLSSLLDGKQIIKTIYVKGKLLNIVAK